MSYRVLYRAWSAGRLTDWLEWPQTFKTKQVAETKARTMKLMSSVVEVKIESVDSTHDTRKEG